MSTVNVTHGRVEIRMSPSGALALNALMSGARDHVTDRLGGDYEGSGFERLTGAIDAMMTGPMLGQPLPDRFTRPRGVPVSLGVDPARIVVRAIDLTAEAVKSDTGSASEVLSDTVIRLRTAIGDWLETGPEPDTVPLHLRPDPETADIVRRCAEASARRLEREFGRGHRQDIRSVIADFSGAPGILPASLSPLEPVIVLDPEAAEALVSIIDEMPMPEIPGSDEVIGIRNGIRTGIEPDGPDL